MSTRSTIDEWSDGDGDGWAYTAGLYAGPSAEEVWLEYETHGVTVGIELPPAALKALAAWVAKNPAKETT